MIFSDLQQFCPDCGGDLKHYDRVKRIKKERYHKSEWVYITRRRCASCNKLHRVLPDDILPFKQYSKEVIFGVMDGLIDDSVLGFENFPSGSTMKRWLQDFVKFTHYFMQIKS